MKSTERAILLSFDIEECDVPCEQGVLLDFETQMAISRDGTGRILSVLETFPGIRATFYTTACFAASAPDLITRMKACGEIASHGWSHSAFEPEDLEKSRTALSRMADVPVSGFRMPRMAQVSDASLVEAGYTYDSSSNPTWIPGRYNAFFKPAEPFFKACGLLEIPASVAPLCRFPLFWLSFKNIPLFLFIFLARWTLRNRGFLNLYWHPWEFSPRIAEPQFKVPNFMARYAGDALARRLEQFIAAIQPCGTFMTTADFARKYSGQNETDS